MIATIIIPVSNEIKTDIINKTIAHHRQYTIDLEILISNHGPRPDRDAITAKVIERSYEGNFSLSKTRNAGAWASKTKWLIFSDIDTIYQNDTFESMINSGHQAMVGRSRRDISEDGVGDYYYCANAPLMITAELFESVGGYHEAYHGYGYEDSSFEHKLQLHDCDSKADHIMCVHNIISTIANWKRDDHNRDKFFNEMNITLEERIASDISNYKVQKEKFLNDTSRQIQ